MDFYRLPIVYNFKCLHIKNITVLEDIICDKPTKHNSKNNQKIRVKNMPYEGEMDDVYEEYDFTRVL